MTKGDLVLDKGPVGRMGEQFFLDSGNIFQGKNVPHRHFIKNIPIGDFINVIVHTSIISPSSDGGPIFLFFFGDRKKWLIMEALET